MIVTDRPNILDAAEKLQEKGIDVQIAGNGSLLYRTGDVESAGSGAFRHAGKGGEVWGYGVEVKCTDFTVQINLFAVRLIVSVQVNGGS